MNLIDFCDLGQAPLSNSLISAFQLEQNEVWYPLKIKVCVECFLVQTQDFVEAHDIFTSDYVYFSSYSSTWIVQPVILSIEFIDSSSSFSKARLKASISKEVFCFF